MLPTTACFRSFAALVVLVVLAFAGVAPLTNVAAYNSTVYDPVQASTLLEIAGASYCSADQIEAWNCAFCLSEPNFKLVGTYLNVTSNMQVIVGFAPGSATQEPLVVVAFKGTSPTSIVNWLQDLTFAFLDEECPECAVHEGFYDTYLSVKPQTLDLLAKARLMYPSARLAITGHSLGGALVNIAAIDFLVTEEIDVNIVMSFGQPRVGNPALAAYYASIFSTSTSFRVTHYRDPVPHVPTKFMGYLHHGTEIWYNEASSSYTTCKGGEDPTCADSLLLYNPVDHGTYLSPQFLVKFLECQLYEDKKNNQTNSGLVRDPRAKRQL